MASGSDKYSIKITSASASDPEFIIECVPTNANIERLEIEIRFNGSGEFAAQSFSDTEVLSKPIKKNQTVKMKFHTNARRFGYAVGDSFSIQVGLKNLAHPEISIDFENRAEGVSMVVQGPYVAQFTMTIID